MESYRRPLGDYVGRFEAAFLREKHHRRTPAVFSRSLWKFFSKFPRKSSPAQFAMPDTEDYKVWRLDEGAALNTVRNELRAVRAFFSWLIRECPEFFDFPNPVPGQPFR